MPKFFFYIILLSISMWISTSSYAQEVETSAKTIYLIDDEGMLDIVNVEERNIITLHHLEEEWRFFFEEDKLIALECIQKDVLYKELFEVQPNVYKDDSGNLKLYSQLKNKNEISVTIEANNSLTDLYFSKNNNEEATFYFKNMAVNKSKL